MLEIRIIPCLLLKNEGLVKTVKFKNPKYVGCPINAVKIFNDKEVDELIFLDISASKENKKPPYGLISCIATECFMPFCYGGGIREPDQIKEILSLGAEKVAINTYALENPGFIREATKIFGSQSIVVAMDVKLNFFGKYRVYDSSKGKTTNLDPIEYARQMEEMGAGEIFLNSVDRDGTFSGYDLELIRRVATALTIPVIACGGAGNPEDLEKAVSEGKASAVAAGSLFVFYGKHRAVLINYPLRN
jgi:cyclase